MIERATLIKSKETSCYEVTNTEVLSEAKEAEIRYDARIKAIRDENARMRTAYNKGTKEAETKYKNEIAELKAEIARLKNK